MSRDPVQLVIDFNRRFLGRYPELLRRKIARITASPFGFFRGTFHLFARDMLAGVLDPWENSNPFTANEICIIGDIHSENFGTFKADDKAVWFDINDFDETTRGSFDFDCKRMAASLFLAAGEHGLDWPDAVAAVIEFGRAYAKKIAHFAKHEDSGDFGFNDSRLPDAPKVKSLIQDAASASRSQFIEQMTELDGHRRKFKGSAKHFRLQSQDEAQCKRLIEDYLTRVDFGRRGEQKRFYDVEDICGRIAGDGSLGRLRYVALLAGEDADSAKNLILELKESLPSAYDELRSRGLEQSARRDRAADVISTTRRMQTASNRYLGYAVDENASFQVREIGPRDRRLEWKQAPDSAEYQDLARLYAGLLAKCHAKSGASQTGGSSAQLISAALDGRVEVFVKRVTAFALAYSELVEDDHRRLVDQRSVVESILF